jgi:hypothetical protein
MNHEMLMTNVSARLENAEIAQKGRTIARLRENLQEIPHIKETLRENEKMVDMMTFMITPYLAWAGGLFFLCTTGFQILFGVPYRYPLGVFYNYPHLTYTGWTLSP